MSFRRASMDLDMSRCQLMTVKSINPQKISRIINLVLRVLGWIMTPLYHFDLVSLPIGLLLAVTFFGLLAVSGALAWFSGYCE